MRHRHGNTLLIDKWVVLHFQRSFERACTHV
jgi:hypothetical protein